MFAWVYFTYFYIIFSLYNEKFFFFQYILLQKRDSGIFLYLSLYSNKPAIYVMLTNDSTLCLGTFLFIYWASN